MKKMILTAAVILASAGAYAQHAVGSITLQPKVGLSVANVTDVDNADARVGFVGGVEGEYQATDLLSVSAGLLYSQQGYKKDLPLAGKSTAKLDYINIPIMANVYVVKGLAVKLGVQPGFNVNGKLKTVINAGGQFQASKDVDVKTFDFSIPVGLSYEYQNVVLDARYNWGLTKLQSNFDAKNSVFQVTLGYKFEL